LGARILLKSLINNEYLTTLDLRKNNIIIIKIEKNNIINMNDLNVPLALKDNKTLSSLILKGNRPCDEPIKKKRSKHKKPKPKRKIDPDPDPEPEEGEGEAQEAPQPKEPSIFFY
jgi:hypothetical protein